MLLLLLCYASYAARVVDALYIAINEMLLFCITRDAAARRDVTRGAIC